MNLQPKILSNAFLINGYTPAVDMILVILCILLLLLLRETFIRRSRLFLLFRTCIALLLIAAFSNSCFYYTVLYFDSDTTLCILRTIYHSSLLLIFCLYAAYLKILIGIPGKTGHIMNIFLYSLYIIFAIVDALSPVLGYSFYRDSSGAWHDNLYLKPFTIAYGIYMAFIFFLLLYYHKRIPTSLFHMLVIVQFICVFLVCAENHFGSNTFLAITFLLPIMVILYMVHGSSYSIKTGALNADSLNEYLNQQASIQISTYYMCLRFDTDSEYVMPDELGKLFFNFWNGYFKNGLLFHPSTDFFVLAIDVSDIRNADKIAQDMIQNDFKRHFETYKLPYKIVMFNHLDFCENLEQFYELFNFFAEPMELNNFRSCDTADYKSFHDMKYLSAQLKDIAENGSLDDKRVLVYCQPVRNVNAGKTFNVQEDMLPVYAQEDGAGIRELAAGAAGVQPGQIVGQELYLYVREKGHFVGRDGEWILAPRLDDQQCVYGVIQGLLSSRVHNKIAMAAVFHNEEVGSGTRQGADSTFLEDVITWITEAIGISDGGKRRMITNSFLISADNAHGIHPNYESKADPTNQPLLNGGIVLKFHGGQKYTSDAMTSGYLRTLCKGAGVSCQSYHNRSDIAGGSTLGNISTAHVSIPSVDIGLAQWAMHSAMETAGTKDLDALIRLCEHFYGVD